jgi:hypothetical protein
MANSTEFKLPVGKIIRNSFSKVWNDKEEVLKAIALPTFFLVIVISLTDGVETKKDFAGLWGAGILCGFVGSWFAISCHRLILVPNLVSYWNFNYGMFIRVLKFFSITLLVYLLISILAFLVTKIFVKIYAAHATSIEKQTAINVIGFIAYTIEMYFLGLFSLVFPAIAIDYKASLSWSMTITTGNGLNMFAIVGLLPLFFKFIGTFLMPENATILEKTVISVAYTFGLAIQIFALSMVYKEFENYYTRKVG